MIFTALWDIMTLVKIENNRECIGLDWFYQFFVVVLWIGTIITLFHVLTIFFIAVFKVCFVREDEEEEEEDT